MPLVYAAVIAALIGLYLLFLAVAIPFAAVVAFVAYAAGLPIAYLTGMVQVLGLRSPGLPPSPRWPKPPGEEVTRWPHHTKDGEPAELGYFYGPAVADVDQVVRISYGHAQKGWDMGGGFVASAFDTDDGLPFTVPFGLGAAVGGAVGSVVGMAGFALCGLVHLAVTGISFVAVRATGATIRGVDSAFLRLKNIRMTCPECYERVAYPAYRCPAKGCRYVHADIRPGRYGIVRRKCRCGERLPTVLLFGSSRMDAFCPYCAQSLEHRPGEAREIVLPLFGASGAGKTRLLYGIVVLLRELADQGKLTAEFADTSTTRSLDTVDEFLAPDRATPKTRVDLPRAQVIRLTVAKGVRILHLFDAAGERFYRTDMTQELRYLDKARTFILVIDPLSVESLWERLPEERRALLSETRSRAPSPELAYQQTHQEMEAMGVRLSHARLAVVFSRADLIGDLGGPADDIEHWARETLGLGNLLRSMRHSFGETQFFRTAAIVGDDGLMHDSVAGLTRWLLRTEGVELPGAVR